ncbi:hypothetical protein TNCV_4969911 [Trichonephila clavipes]|nr:hypothetical protein TNCV_4969911 [Trichonephila clavipes]
MIFMLYPKRAAEEGVSCQYRLGMTWDSKAKASNGRSHSSSMQQADNSIRGIFSKKHYSTICCLAGITKGVQALPFCTSINFHSPGNGNICQ